MVFVEALAIMDATLQAGRVVVHMEQSPREMAARVESPGASDDKHVIHSGMH